MIARNIDQVEREMRFAALAGEQPIIAWVVTAKGNQMRRRTKRDGLVTDAYIDMQAIGRLVSEFGYDVGDYQTQLGCRASMLEVVADPGEARLQLTQSLMLGTILKRDRDALGWLIENSMVIVEFL